MDAWKDGESMQEMIRFEHLCKSYGGIRALDDVSFSIHKGEVHAIVGENGAGKSTLMNILGGVRAGDSGKIFLEGQAIRFSSPIEARQRGISTVFQELMLCENLNVAGNIYLGRELRKGVGLDWKAMHAQAAEILRSYGLDFSSDTQLKELTVAQMQMLEIARALSSNAKVLILDEPTSSLTENETRKLFDHIKRLKQQGVTILFISHRLEEIFYISDRISVMRNGGYITTLETKETDMQTVVNYIAGKNLTHETVARQDRTQMPAVLEAINLSDGKIFHHISFRLHQGEILGFYGLQGSGRTEIIETIYGLRKRKSGSVRIHGKECAFRSANDAINAGIGIVTEDRKLWGIFSLMSIRENIGIIQKELIKGRLGLLSHRKMEKLAQQYSDSLHVKTDTIENRITNLSGGNQQKALIARMLSRAPEIILMDEPTRGVDVGAKAEIFTIMRKLRDQGKSMIVISSEIEEVITECDRVIVMHEGVISGELRGAQISKANILEAAFANTKNRTTEI